MSSKTQIGIFIVFALCVYAFIYFTSRPPKQPETQAAPAQDVATIGQETLPTQAASDEETRGVVYTSKAGDFSFEHPVDWEASESAVLKPDTDMGTPVETALFASANQYDAVLLQIFPAGTRKTESLFGCGTTTEKQCQTKQISGVTYTLQTESGGADTMTRIGTVANNKIYSLKVLGPTDQIFSSISLVQ